jgi:type VI secretion system secreted protein VgrG
MADPLPKVRFKFTAKTSTSVWRVVTLHAREALSELYTVALELACDDLNADPDELLGDTAEVWLARESHERKWNGLIHRVERRGVAQGHLVCRVHLVPALYGLSKRVDSFIFQDMTVPQIVAIVLAEGLSPYDRQVDFTGLTARYPTREYCTQYRETDLEFVLRLLAEEGIAFWFDHRGDAEVMKLVDGTTAYGEVPTMDGAPLQIMGPEAGTAAVERLRHFEQILSLESTSAVVRDFDWTRPRIGVPGRGLSAEARSTDARGRDRETYEYPAPLTLGEYNASTYTDDDGATQATLRRELYASRARRFVGDGEVIGFSPGHTFSLVGHLVHAFDRDYLLTRCEHFGHAPEELTADVTPDEARRDRYRNTFECIPADVVFRPTRSVRRPVLAGAQTATVVGPPGEEVHTDVHGRIKVQFHWDREGQRNADSSLWIRCAQPWAGSGWGFMFIPRVGMEVVVTFLEGNPDRPLVTGCVYNGENQPAYVLPDDKTRSWIRTNSSPSNGGYNELRFEDLAGSEEVYLRAQRDFNELVRRNHSTTVNANQSNTVHGAQTETVDQDKTITVHKNRSTTIDGNDFLHVKGQRYVVVDGAAGGPTPPPEQGAGLLVTGTYTVKASQKIRLEVGGSSITIDGSSIVLVAGGGAGLALTADAHLKANGNGQLFLDANAHLRANGGGDLYLTADANLTANGGGKLFLNANADLGGGTVNVHSSGASVVLDGNATVTGGTVKLNA